MWQDPRGAKDHKPFDINHVFGSATKIVDGTLFQCLHAFSSWQVQGSIIFTPSRVLPRFFAMVIQVSGPNKYMFNIQVLQCFIPNHGFPTPKRFFVSKQNMFSHTTDFLQCFCDWTTPVCACNGREKGEKPSIRGESGDEERKQRKENNTNPSRVFQHCPGVFSPGAHVVCFRTFPQSSPGFCCHMDLGSSLHLRKQQNAKTKQQPATKQQAKTQTTSKETKTQTQQQTTKNQKPTKHKRKNNPTNGPINERPNQQHNNQKI